MTSSVVVHSWAVVVVVVVVIAVMNEHIARVLDNASTLFTRVISYPHAFIYMIIYVIIVIIFIIMYNRDCNN